MRKIKVLIIFLIVIILILTISIGIALINGKNENDIEKSSQGDLKISTEDRYKISIDSFQVYYQVSDCINQYIKYVTQKNSVALEKISWSNISQQTNLQNISNINNLSDLINSKYVVKDISSIESSFEKPYFVKGVLLNRGNQYNIYFAVIIDTNNSTYLIRELLEEDYKEFITGNLNFTEKTIEKNDYNIINKTYYSQEDIARIYFYDYIENAVYNTKYAYETLNESYKSKKFDDYDEYKNYLKRNIEDYKLMERNRAKTRDDFNSDDDYDKYIQNSFSAGLRKYKINKEEDYTQYICMDSNENYYIFNVFPDFSYDVILDTYTIDLPQFTEKYNSSNIQQKVAMNIDKFIKSLNDKDYKYAYNCLADGFKNNKFKDIEIFEKFMEQNIFEKNVLEFKSFKNEGETYIFNIILKNAEKDSETKNMQIIMKLGEGTDFVMSFNI